MKVITVGREKGNTIVISSDRYVGRRHLELTQDDSGNIQIIDLNSTNGTFVNGKKLTGNKSVYLSPTDIVRIGNTTLPWKSYFIEAVILDEQDEKDEKDEKKKKCKKEKVQREKKPMNWRNVLSIVMTIFSLMFMIMMLLRMLKK
jgi:pSer/pThr/pTyr-binding forkhead associated (FHA) protein